MEGKEAASDLANQVLSHTDILQVIGERISLTRRGNSHIACCPFHQEKTPSFHVMPKDQYYYCFGCKASGNAIHFLREYDRMSFFEALKYLARQAGISMPALDSNQSKTPPGEFEWLDKVTEFFQEKLKETPHAIDYLKGRHITGNTAKTFAIGFAMEQWDALLQSFNTSSEALDRLQRNGLIITKDNGRRYDRFRNRIMFPIREARGKTIAYGARTLGDDTPKYLNSPQTPLFNKSNALYGIYELLTHLRRPDFILIVEGYMDVIALHQAGIPEVVATLGTASNQGQLRQLQRYTDRIIVCFDGDNAGRKAAWHALKEALPIANERLDLRFLFLPEKEDPDSFVQKNGAEAMKELIGKAQPLSEAFFDHLLSEHNTETLDGKARCVKAGMEAINTMPTGIFQTLLAQELSKRLEIQTRHIESELNPTPQPVVATPPTRRSNTATQGKPIGCIQRALTLLLKDTALAKANTRLQRLDEKAHLLLSPPSELKLLVSAYKHLKSNPELTTGQLINHYDNEAVQAHLLNVCSQIETIDSKLLAAEFEDALSLSLKWCINNQIETLIDTGKKQPLSEDEKEKLQILLKSRSETGI